MYRATIHNVISGGILVMALGTLVLNYRNLDDDRHGYFLVSLIFSGGVGILVLLLDFILQRTVKDYIRLNFIEAVMLFVLMGWLIMGVIVLVE